MLHARDVAGAQEGGADRLWLATEAGLSPDLQVVSSVLKETDLPVRVILRLNDSHTTTGGEFTRLGGLAKEYLSLGAEECRVRLPRPGPRGRRRHLRGPGRPAHRGAVDVPGHRRRVPGAVPRLAPPAHPARPGRGLLGGFPARPRGRVRRPAGAGAVRPGGRRPADAGRPAWSPSRSRGWSGPGSTSSTSTTRSARAARPRRTSTPRWSAPGGCCSGAEVKRTVGTEPYFTAPDLSRRCVDFAATLLDLDAFALIVEPGAGCRRLPAAPAARPPARDGHRAAAPGHPPGRLPHLAAAGRHRAGADHRQPAVRPARGAGDAVPRPCLRVQRRGGVHPAAQLPEVDLREPRRPVLPPRRVVRLRGVPRRRRPGPQRPHGVPGLAAAARATG